MTWWKVSALSKSAGAKWNLDRRWSPLLTSPVLCLLRGESWALMRLCARDRLSSLCKHQGSKHAHLCNKTVSILGAST